ncbi:hypothetical protein [Streptosporangium sp. KLBMP 9127]|nr:hypothetical protein [Streptosporangium sp. KLBMP 9127]
MSQSVAEYLRDQAWRRLDRVERRDGGRNARCALALLDAAAYADLLDDEDPLIAGLHRADFGPRGFDPGERVARLIRSWESGEPWQLLLAMRSTLQSTLT